jgi:hypothetical protein
MSRSVSISINIYPDPVPKALRQRGINVLTAQEAGRCGLADVDQLKFATANERVMVTLTLIISHYIPAESNTPALLGRTCSNIPSASLSLCWC